MKTLVMLFLVAILLTPASAADVTGVWVSQDGLVRRQSRVPASAHSAKPVKS